MTQDEALKLALEALERCVATCFDQYAHEQVMGRPEHFVNQTITAIKEALEQPAYRAVKTFHEGKPVYVAQRPWVSLTDEEIETMLNENFGFKDSHTFARAIEAKLRSKNL
jgi:hypothetical protein